MKSLLSGSKLLLCAILFITTQVNAQTRYWIHKPYYENFFSTPAELAQWNLVEDNGSGSWVLTGSGTALLTMDNAAGSFANRLFNVNGAAANLLPLDRVNGRIEIMVKAITGGNQRIFVQVQQFDASNTYLGEFSLLPGQSATGFFSINLNLFSWNPSADKIRLIIGGENYSGQQGTVEFDYFSYSNDNGNWSNAANWSVTSNGAGGASVPGFSDIAIFDGAGGNNGSCLLTANTSVGGIDITSGYTGNFDLQGYQLTIGSSGANIAGGGVAGNSADILVNGNLDISGGAFRNLAGTNAATGDVSITGGVLDFSTGSVIFDGTGIQQFNSTMINPIHKLIINKPSGKVLFNSDILISDSLILTNGILETNGHTVRLGLSATAIGKLIPGAGKINGSFKRWISNSSTGDIDFPLGNDTVDAPLTVSINSAASAGGSITATYSDAVPAFDVVNFMDGLTTIIGRSTAKWNLQTTGITGGTYTINAANNHLAGFSNLSDLHLSLSNSVAGTHLAATGTLLNPVLHRSGLTVSELTQDWFAALSTPSVLPLNWGSFRANENNWGIALNWTTLQESNTAYFTVQHSTDALRFTDIEQLAAKGFSNTTSYYSYTDQDPVAGILNYYRLKQVDRDGQFLYSTIVSVKAGNLKKSSVGIAGPVKDELKLISVSSGIEINISDYSGRLLTSRVLNAGSNSINCSNWSKGVFYVSVFENGRLIETKRFLKQ